MSFDGDTRKVDGRIDDLTVVAGLELDVTDMQSLRDQFQLRRPLTVSAPLSFAIHAEQHVADSASQPIFTTHAALFVGREVIAFGNSQGQEL
jgi:hypothetical protein